MQIAIFALLLPWTPPIRDGINQAHLFPFACASCSVSADLIGLYRESPMDKVGGGTTRPSNKTHRRPSRICVPRKGERHRRSRRARCECMVGINGENDARSGHSAGVMSWYSLLKEADGFHFLCVFQTFESSNMKHERKVQPSTHLDSCRRMRSEVLVLLHVSRITQTQKVSRLGALGPH